MNKIKKILQIFLLLIFLTSCKTSIKKDKPIMNPKEDFNENVNSEKKIMEIKFSCGENRISEYLEDGWIILKEDSKKNLYWKSICLKRL